MGSKPTCDDTSLGSIRLLAHSAPYRLWYGTGDPDEDAGVKYIHRR
jgi:hypothetical protein